jgi:hypothetical protein
MSKHSNFYERIRHDQKVDDFCDGLDRLFGAAALAEEIAAKLDRLARPPIAQWAARELFAVGQTVRGAALDLEGVGP